ncbi:zinc metalloproteinase nas-15-like [Ischnura elegans]|uniref:zinc metalloproteinase nas-15-like n=1 Tax=Ischnura elegans TaxID=197161 RepID=UPI001ED882EE|nr:zinc metalloproteinase nas-15-like [Ischnura elegans]
MSIHRVMFLRLAALLALSTAAMAATMASGPEAQVKPPKPPKTAGNSAKEAIDNSPGQPLTLEDYANADQFGSFPESPSSPQPTPESEDLFEGDIAGVAGVTAENLRAAARGGTTELAEVRNAVRFEDLLWPDGRVPYVISIAFDENERAAIASAILEFHRRSCIRFIPRSTQKDYVYILKGEGCSSLVGRAGYGVQALSIGYGCAQRGVVIHELLHAVGFWHEHSRADRDEHVVILWNNIRRGMEYNFERLSWQFVTDLGAAYDTGSVMHYDPFSFSKDYSSPTILPKKRGTPIGQRYGFSDIDLWKLNRLYRCRRAGGWSGGVSDNVISGAKNEFRCMDRHVHCLAWARSGECYNNANYMTAICPSSCGACT